MRLTSFVSAAGKRNKGAKCTDVYSVTNSHGFVPSTEYFSKEVFSKELEAYRLVERGMLAYNPSRINVGSIALQESADRVVVSPLYVVFSVDTRHLAPGYLLRFLKSKPGLNQIAFRSSGTVRSNLKFDALSLLEMPLPSIDVQEKRLVVLSRLEKQIEARGEFIASLDTLVKSRFIEMFGDPIALNSNKKSRLDSFAKIITGNTPSRKKPEYYGDYIEWIKTDNITSTPVLTKAAESLSEDGASAGRIAPSGSVLMSCIAGSVKSIGKVAIADRPVAFNQQINAIIPADGILTEYLYWMLSLSKDYLCSDINMQLKGILNKTALSRKMFCVPPPSLQQEFATFVRQVDKLRFESGQDRCFQSPA